MTGRVAGKRALVTGAALGQGRAHAVRLAEEGADLVLVDLLTDYPDVPYPMGTAADLEETVALAEKAGARVTSHVADVRDRAAMDRVVGEAGPVDVVVANAGICPAGTPFWEVSERQWQAVMDVNAKGVWTTVSAVAPRMIEAGTRGSIVVTASVLGLKGGRNMADYSAAKHAVVGLMRSMALDLAPHMIRVNALCPNSVDTNMINNETIFQRFRPDLENPRREDTVEGFKSLTVMPVPWLEPVDIANAMLWLASDESRYVTGVTLPVDLGGCLK
jgi:SDR family mycofactocin-dependent oxidoreductase